MSLHSTYFGSAGIGQLLRAQGEPIELAPKNGDADTMTALVASEESDAQVSDERGRKNIRKRKFTITKDPTSEFGGAVDPQENAVVTYATIDYAVRSRQDCGDYWELLCEFIGRSERTRGGLRAQE
jgi:hypothetical protein